MDFFVTKFVVYLFSIALDSCFQYNLNFKATYGFVMPEFALYHTDYLILTQQIMLV